MVFPFLVRCFHCLFHLTNLFSHDGFALADFVILFDCLQVNVDNFKTCVFKIQWNCEWNSFVLVVHEN